MAVNTHPVSAACDSKSVRTDRVRILGVNIRNCDTPEAIGLLDRIIRQRPKVARSIFIVNAHTLNLASENRSYLETLRRGDIVLGDGTGIRWAARLRGKCMKDNLVGTDLVPAFFADTAGRGYSYFLLGGDAPTIERAAAAAGERFPGWRCAGFHHGYLNDSTLTGQVIDAINASSADVLLVGMGNPKQEQWIAKHLDDLRVPLSIGVGGLFDHWGGNLTRAATWIRALGFEWLQLLGQQPGKWRRYVLGNPKFLFRILKARQTDMESIASGSE